MLGNIYHIQSRIYTLPYRPSPTLSKFPQRVQRVLHKDIQKGTRVTDNLERLHRGCDLWTEDLLWGWALLPLGYREALERPRPTWQHFTAKNTMAQ